MLSEEMAKEIDKEILRTILDPEWIMKSKIEKIYKL
jgi:hypothetical protein